MILKLSMKLKINFEDAKKRIDIFLSENLDSLSRSQIQKLIPTLTVNNNPVKKNYILEENDVIELKIPKQKETKIKPIKETLDIKYQDEHILIIDKPADLPVHPDKKHSHERTLVNILLGNKIPLSTLGGEDRPGIVHRLDKDTSGLIIIAKTDEAYKTLREKFTNKKIKKTYLALVIDPLRPEKGRIKAPIGRSAQDRKKMSVKTGKNAKQAITNYKVSNNFESKDLTKPVSLLEVEIPTGRTHQIRVHLQAISHPIIGDTAYGNSKLNEQARKLGLKRQFLHAHKLEFTHPITNEKIALTSDLPEELQNFIEKLN